MRRITQTLGLLALFMVGTSCNDSTTEPSGGACTAETTSVTVSVTGGSNPVFSWAPRCAVAIVLVEDDASDQWGVGTPEDSWTSQATGNLITPPITYGSTPQGTESFQEPETLIAGRTYELILWRVLPSGSTATCLQKIDNLCLLTVHEFKR